MCVRDYEKGEETEIVRIINPRASQKEIENALKRWRHLYAENPFTDKKLIRVAQLNGTVIGCYHLMTREMKLIPLGSCLTVLSGDMAVKPEFQGQGIGSLLSNSLTAELSRSKGIKLIYGFGSLRSHGFWAKIGYKKLKIEQRFYSKTLKLTAYRPHIEEASKVLSRLGISTSISISASGETIYAPSAGSVVPVIGSRISLFAMRLENLGGLTRFIPAVLRGAVRFNITLAGAISLFVLAVYFLLARRR